MCGGGGSNYLIFGASIANYLANVFYAYGTNIVCRTKNVIEFFVCEILLLWTISESITYFPTLEWEQIIWLTNISRLWAKNWDRANIIWLTII